MMLFDRIALGRQARVLGFVRDSFEKVCRLTEVLDFMGSDPLLKTVLALKGGTAINLAVLKLPRLSVDIDLDYTRDTTKEQMHSERQQINDHLQKYMTASGYTLSPRSKHYHALDSFVYEYVNAGNTKDNLKIEINYMLRCHVLPVSLKEVRLPWSENELTVSMVATPELFAAKTAALLNRAAARDLYDVFNMQDHLSFDEEQEKLFRKCTVFYSAISSGEAPKGFDFTEIDNITARKVKTELTTRIDSICLLYKIG